MKLSPEHCRAAYEFLRSTAPFNRWKLPPGDLVAFKVSKKATDYYGWHIPGERHTIQIAAAVHGHTMTLLKTIAHEMVHVAQKTMKWPYGHNQSFDKAWARVARLHGFDPKDT